MRLKRAYIYISGFVVLSIAFTFCYYLSYRHALHQFNKKSLERENLLLNGQEDEEVEFMQVDSNSAEIVKPSTKYILQNYDLNSNLVEELNLNMPGQFVGLTREELINELNRFMEDMPLSEHNKGLTSYELLSFSKDKIVLRKTYNIDKLAYMFYIAVRDGLIVVYNSDLKTIYQYTNIVAEDLSEEDRISLSNGIYIKDLSELYSVLESYSS